MVERVDRERKSVSKAPSERACVWALAAITVTWGAFIVTSTRMASHPIVLADEAAYLLPTLFGSGAENYARWGIIPQIPSLVYYWIYGAFAGSDPYSFAKLLNAIFIVSAVVPIYMILRAYLACREAAAFSIVVMCAPISSFARYFMPESMYFFGYWWTIYALLVTLRRSTLVAGLAAGIALGLLSFVKPHALMLVVGIGIFFLLRPGRPRERLLASIVLALSCYVVHIGVGRALSRSWDLSVTGSVYGAQLSISRFEVSALLFNAFGHFASLVLLAGLPLTMILVALVRGRGQSPPHDLTLLALCMLGTLVIMTIYYSHSVFLIDPLGQPVSRLHGRYYAYTLPLVMLAYIEVVRAYRKPSALFSDFALVTFGIGTLVALFLISRIYEAGIADYPELTILAKWPRGISVAGAAFAALLVGSRLLRKDRFCPDLWRHALPVIWWATIMLSTSMLLLAGPLTGKWSKPKDLDRLMWSNPTLRALRQRDDGMIVGTPEAALDTYRVMFHLASRSRGRMLGPKSALGPDAIPNDVKWLILLPGASYAGPGEQEAIGPLTLVKLH
jgi:hypothetical protein